MRRLVLVGLLLGGEVRLQDPALDWRMVSLRRDCATRTGHEVLRVRGRVALEVGERLGRALEEQVALRTGRDREQELFCATWSATAPPAEATHG